MFITNNRASFRATAQNEKIKLVFETADPGHSVRIDDLRNILVVSTSAP